MSANYRPEMTDAGLDPTQATLAVDEYQNQRDMQIADERPLTIYVDRFEIVTLMTLGCQPELLTLGYLKNQDFFSNLNEIKSIQVDWEVNAAVVTTTEENTDWHEKLSTRTVTTGCGQGTIFGNLMEQLDSIEITPHKIKQSDIYATLKNLNVYNDVYKSAGAVHGCALCHNTEILSFKEDVGRHNAVDAIAGEMWLNDIDGKGKLFYTTGRLTSEMVIKVAQMGVPTLLSRSGITNMGLQIARNMGVTLFSRAKGKHFLIYNDSENVEFDVDLPDKFEVANIKKVHQK
ncbi:MAG: formate dehydrogenase accessory sulfurtransferase FdhD [Gammaproteobacteria bacterium]